MELITRLQALDAARDLMFTFLCAFQAPAGSREGPSPLSNELMARPLSVLPGCEPRAESMDYEVEAIT